MNTYYKGSVPRLTATFKNISGVKTDPTTITFHCVQPDGTVYTRTYGGVDAQVKRSEAGVYYIDFLCAQGGRHGYQWTGAGAVVAVAEGGFYVRDDVVFSN